MNSLKFASLSVALLGCALANAQEIAYNNFGPAFETGNGGGFIGKFSTNTVPLFQGYQFTSLTSGLVNSVIVKLDTIFNGDTQAFENSAGAIPTFDLYSNGGSDDLGTLLASYTGVGVVTSGQLETLVPSGLASLTAGSKYWLVARDAGDETLNTVYSWINAYNDLEARKAFSIDGTNFSYEDNKTMGSFQIQTVPEPASMAILGVGVVSILRRRRKA